MGRHEVAANGQPVTAVRRSMYTSDTMRHSAGILAHSKTERIVWKMVSSLGTCAGARHARRGGWEACM